MKQKQKYDCDTCRYFPCIYQKEKGENIKIKKGECGDKDEK